MYLVAAADFSVSPVISKFPPGCAALVGMPPSGRSPELLGLQTTGARLPEELPHAKIVLETMVPNLDPRPLHPFRLDGLSRQNFRPP